MLARNTAINLISQGMTMVLALIINIVVARTLGPTGKGAFSLLVLSSGLVMLSLNFGLGRAAIYYLSKGTDTLPSIADNLFCMTLLIGTVSTFLLIAGLPYYSNVLFPGIPYALVAVVMAVTPFSLWTQYAGHMFAGLQDFWRYNGINVLGFAIRLAFLIIFLLVASGGLAAAVLALAVSIILPAIVGWYWVRQRTGEIRLRMDMPLTKRYISYGFRANSAQLVSYMNLRFDQFLVSVLMGLASVGIYSVAVMIAELAGSLAEAITMGLFTQVSTLDGESARHLTARTTRITLAITVFMCVGLLLGGKYIILLLFGAEFVSGTLALQVLLPGVVALSLSKILASHLAGRGRPEIGLYASLLGLVITIVGDLLLIPRMGIVGAALISSLTYIASMVVVLFVYMHNSHESLRHLLWPTLDDAKAIHRLLLRIPSMMPI